jgi:hypothetical protein
LFSKKDKEEGIIYNITMSDNIYVDLNMSNLNLTRIPASFNERRNGDIIEKPSEYEISITRFQVSTSSLPVFIPTIASNSIDPNKTILEISMSSNGYSVKNSVLWIPEINMAPPKAPSENMSGFQSQSEYYYAYSYSWLPFLVQKTLLKCFQDLQALDSSLETAGRPYFYFDPLSGGCSILSCDSNFFDTYNVNGDNSLTNVKIFFNEPMYHLFSSFNSTYDGNSLYEIIVNSNNFNKAEIHDINYSKVLQEYSTVQCQNPVKSIAFTSSNLPVVAEIINSPLLFVNGKSMTDQASNSTSKIITDIQSSSLSYKPELTMVPTAEFRYISLHQGGPINEMQISIFWRNLMGDFIPLYLPSGGTASLKIYFKKIK